MRAVVYDQYGTVDQLRLVDREKPSPGSGEVLVRVRASSINSWDWDLLTGTFQGRLGFMAWRRPKLTTLGADVAGHVAAVGPNVDELQVGDEVFGDVSGQGFGGFAEYVTVPAKVLAVTSSTISVVQAAATPQAGLLALRSLRDRRALAPGHRILINGAGGGVGTFAIQIAKSMGAEVTGVDRAIKSDRMRSVGADHVIDYHREDFTRTGKRYDLILDVVASRSVRAYQRALRPDGVAIIVGGTMRSILGAAVLGKALTTKGRRVVVHQHRVRRDDLADLNARIERGDLAPVIDSTFALEDLAQAFRRFSEGQAAGKIVILT